MAVVQAFSNASYNRYRALRRSTGIRRESEDDFRGLAMSSVATGATVAPFDQVEVYPCQTQVAQRLRVVPPLTTIDFHCDKCLSTSPNEDLILVNEGKIRLHWQCVFDEESSCPVCSGSFFNGDLVWDVGGRPYHVSCADCYRCGESLRNALFFATTSNSNESANMRCLFHKSCNLCHYCSKCIAFDELYMYHYWWPETLLCHACVHLPSCFVCSRKSLGSTDEKWNVDDIYDSESRTNFGSSSSASPLCHGCRTAGVVSTPQQAEKCLQDVFTWLQRVIEDTSAASGYDSLFEIHLTSQDDFSQRRIHDLSHSLHPLPTKRWVGPHTDFTKFCTLHKVNSELPIEKKGETKGRYKLAIRDDLPKPVFEFALAAQLSKVLICDGEVDSGLNGFPHALAWVYATCRLKELAREVLTETCLEAAKPLQAQKDLSSHLSNRLKYSQHPIHGTATRHVVRLIGHLGLRKVVEYVKRRSVLPNFPEKVCNSLVV